MAGVLFALVGLCFFAVFVAAILFGPERRSVLLPPDRSVWIAGLVSLAASVVCIFAAKYFFTLDVNAPDELPVRSSRFDPFFIAHRSELKIVAQIGFAISLIRLGAACLGVDWPGRWVTWTLLLTVIGLLVAGGPLREPGMTALKVIEKVAGAAFLLLLLLTAWNAFSQRKVVPEIVRAALVALLFAGQTLFFARADTRVETPDNVLKS